jgi:DNA-binding MarR family transcriptional regulator
LAHNHERDNYIVSDAVTVIGISKHLKCSIGYASYLINKYGREGLISRSKAKVVLGNRVQESVFLTESGINLVKELEASILKQWKRVK